MIAKRLIPRVSAGWASFIALTVLAVVAGQATCGQSVIGAWLR